MKRIIIYLFVFLFFLILFLYLLFPYDNLVNNISTGRNMNIYVSEINQSLLLVFKCKDFKMAYRDVIIGIDEFSIDPEIFKLCLFKKIVNFDFKNIYLNKSGIFKGKINKAGVKLNYKDTKNIAANFYSKFVELNIFNQIIRLNNVNVKTDLIDGKLNVILKTSELSGKINLSNSTYKIQIKFSDYFLREYSAIKKLIPGNKFKNNEYIDIVKIHF